MGPLLALILAAGAAPALPVLHTADELFAAAKAAPGPVVVHFWATWCPGCVAELPQIRALAEGLSEGPASLIFVSLDPPEKVSDVRRFMAKEQLLRRRGTSAVLLDAPDPAPVTARFDPQWTAQLPATFVVLHSGELVASHLGTTPVSQVLAEARDAGPEGKAVARRPAESPPAAQPASPPKGNTP